MTQVITDPGAFTPALVTKLLSTSGALQHGEIVAVQVKEEETGMSRIVQLDLTASDDAMPHVGIRPNERRSKNFIHPTHGARSVRGVVLKRSTGLPTNWVIDSRLPH